MQAPSFEFTLSPDLEIAVQSLMAAIAELANNHFDAQQLNLDEAELIALISALLSDLQQHLDGRLLSGLLLTIREAASINTTP